MITPPDGQVNTFPDFGGQMDAKAESPETLVYDVPEAGRLLGMGRSASYEAARSGQLPTIKIGGRYKVPKTALHKMLDSVGQGPSNG
jgi:excisionase family DNA binding protein